MISGVWVVVRKACPTTRLWKNALTLFSTVFVVSILHLSFCSFFLVYGVMCGSTFIFLQMATQLPQQHLWLAHLHVVLVLTKTETDLSTFFSQLLCWDWIEIQLSVFPPVGHFFFFFMAMMSSTLLSSLPQQHQQPGSQLIFEWIQAAQKARQDFLLNNKWLKRNPNYNQVPLKTSN